MYFSFSLSSSLSAFYFLLLMMTFLSGAEIREFAEIYNVNNCAELNAKGATTSGIYNINVKVWQGRKKIQVYCDMYGGWTVIQRRTEKDGHRIHFNRTFTEYATGFGDLAKEFWLGNDNIHILTSADDLMLRVLLKEKFSPIQHAEYEQFFVENQREGYKLYIGHYSGNAGDGMRENNLNLFYTYDQDTKDKCARHLKSGWWHYPSGCSISNLNGDYSIRNIQDDSSVYWNRRKPVYLLPRIIFWKTVEMKVRPMKFKPA